MTANRPFKRLVRARAARTGESYASALRHFRGSTAKGQKMEHLEKSAERMEIGECSFCKKPSNEVGKIFGGAGAYICQECVERMHELIPVIDRGELDPTVAKSGGDLPTEMLLAALPRIAATGRQVDRDIGRTIQRLRTRDVHWETIADALGTDADDLMAQFPDPL